MYRDGLGVAQDHAEAVSWYRKAAEQGHSRAQTNLGDMCRDGLGVAQDYAEAVKWYRLAAEQGSAAPCYNLGLAYKHGRGVKKDRKEAAQWFKKAADLGYEEAKKELQTASDRTKERPAGSRSRHPGEGQGQSIFWQFGYP
jgi:TPR repeat protein